MSEKDNSNLSPAQANFVYWFNGLLPIATNILTPVTVYLKMAKSGKSVIAKYNQQVNEVGRQFISGTLGLLTYFGGGELTRALVNFGMGRKEHNGNGTNISKGDKQVAMIVGAGLTSFVGYSWIRPLISTSLINQFQKETLSGDVSLNKTEILTALSQALTKGSKTLHLDRAKEELNISLKNKALAESAKAKSDHVLIRKAQEWVDQHLFVNGAPQLKKAAGMATVLLSTYLSLLTGVMWGINRLVGKEPDKSKSKEIPQLVANTAMPQSPALPISGLPVGTPIRPSSVLYTMPPTVYPATQLGVYSR